MMRLAAIITGIFFCVLTSNAQDILNIQAGIGPSFGVGQFASDDMQDSSSGFAGYGGVINLHVGLKPTKNFGICFFGAMAMYPARTKNIQTTINNAFGLDLKAKSNYYRFGIASGGFMFSGRVADRFVVDARLTAGYLWAETPVIEMSDAGIIYYKHYRAPGGGVGANAAFSFRYIIKRVLYVSGGADFIFGYPKFENSIIETRVGTTNVTQQAVYHQWIGAINVTAAIGVSF